jgi:hypothetical protein
MTEAGARVCPLGHRRLPSVFWSRFILWGAQPRQPPQETLAEMSNFVHRAPSPPGYIRPMRTQLTGAADL